MGIPLEYRWLGAFCFSSIINNHNQFMEIPKFSTGKSFAPGSWKKLSENMGNFKKEYVDLIPTSYFNSSDVKDDEDYFVCAKGGSSSLEKGSSVRVQLNVRDAY